MKDYVQIQSDITIMVTCGLQYQNVTNPDAHVPDRLKINAEWPKMSVLIQKGQHVYPSEISTWNTVKALEKDKVLTIGRFLDVSEIEDESVKTVKSDLSRAINEYEAKTKSKLKEKEVKDISLDEIGE